MKTHFFYLETSLKVKSLAVLLSFFLGSLNVLGGGSDDENDRQTHSDRRRSLGHVAGSDGAATSSAAKRSASAAVQTGQGDEDTVRPFSDLQAAAAAASTASLSGHALLQRSMSNHYAIATTDTAFKHMLSLAEGSDKSIVISFLNSFIPAFRGDPVEDVSEAPVAVPPLRRPGEKQTFMDLHVVSKKGVHYIIEMQAQRHVMFDERVLFYASSTYARQLSEGDLGREDWYTRLFPVIALQILDYDTNRIRGIDSSVADTLVERVKQHPLPEGQFVKHYTLVDKHSGQEIDHLQIVQVELPRSEVRKRLFPPQEDFNTMEWWLSILRHSNEYTDRLIEDFHHRKHMPENIYKALKRLDFTEWSARIVTEYKENIARRDLYAQALAVERLEGKQEGLKEGRKEVALQMLSRGMGVSLIAGVTGLSAEEIEKLKAA